MSDRLSNFPSQSFLADELFSEDTHRIGEALHKIVQELESNPDRQLTDRLLDGIVEAATGEKATLEPPQLLGSIVWHSTQLIVQIGDSAVEKLMDRLSGDDQDMLDGVFLALMEVEYSWDGMHGPSRVTLDYKQRCISKLADVAEALTPSFETEALKLIKKYKEKG